MKNYLERLRKKIEEGKLSSPHNLMLSGMELVYQDLSLLDREGKIHIADVADGADVFYIANDGFDWFVEKDTYEYKTTEWMYGVLGEDWFLSKEEAEECRRAML